MALKYCSLDVIIHPDAFLSITQQMGVGSDMPELNIWYVLHLINTYPL